MTYRNRLLVAPPALDEPTFALTVVLVLQHDDGGALGIVLNRPSAMDLPESLQDWATRASEPRVLFVGGPVQPDVVLLVGRSGAGGERRPEEFGSLPPGFTLAQPGERPESATVTDVRAFAGYAGWAPGQLDAEVEAGGWWVVAVSDGDVLTDDPATLWTRVLQRQGGVFTTATPNPAAN